MSVFGSAGAYTKVWHLQTLWPLPGSGRRLARLWAGFAVGPPCCQSFGCRPKHRRQTTFVCSTLLSHGHHAIHALRAVLTRFSTLVALCFACLWQFVNTLRSASRPARVGCRWLPLQQSGPGGPPRSLGGIRTLGLHCSDSPCHATERLLPKRAVLGGALGTLGEGDLCALFDYCLKILLAYCCMTTLENTKSDKVGNLLCLSNKTLFLSIETLFVSIKILFVAIKILFLPNKTSFIFNNILF